MKAGEGRVWREAGDLRGLGGRTNLFARLARAFVALTVLGVSPAGLAVAALGAGAATAVFVGLRAVLDAVHAGGRGAPVVGAHAAHTVGGVGAGRAVGPGVDVGVGGVAGIGGIGATAIQRRLAHSANRQAPPAGGATVLPTRAVRSLRGAFKMPRALVEPVAARVADTGAGDDEAGDVTGDLAGDGAGLLHGVLSWIVRPLSRATKEGYLSPPDKQKPYLQKKLLFVERDM